MPRGNRTGPSGLGAMSGRGAGFCTGNGMPGFANGAFCRRSGRGYGRAAGYGGGNRLRSGWHAMRAPIWARLGGVAATYDDPAAIPNMDPEMEKKSLKSQAGLLKAELERIQNRLAEVEKQGGENPPG